MSNQIKFVGLHAHSVFSVFDGLGIMLLRTVWMPWL
jgi:hypothetical protein